MIAAVAVFSGMDALLKLLSAHYPPMEVTVLRGAASLPFMLLPLLVTGRWRELRMRRFPMHLLRGLLGVVSLGGFVYAVRVLSLANAYAVFLSAPLIVTAAQGARRCPQLGRHSAGPRRSAHHAAAERRGLRHLGSAGGADRGQRLCPAHHRGAGADTQRQHRERGGLDGGPDDRICRRDRRARLGAARARALALARRARRTRRAGVVPAHGGLPVRAGLGGGAVRIHLAPVGHCH